MSVITSRPEAESSSLRDFCLRRFTRCGSLSPDEASLVAALATTGAWCLPGAELSFRGVPPRPQMLASGWACRQRTLLDGRRQIYSFLLPGDFVDFGASDGSLTCSEFSLTRVLLLDIGRVHHAWVERSSLFPKLVEVCDQWSYHQQELLLDHAVRLGRLTARERLVHLLLEFEARLAAVDLSRNGEFLLTLTQEVLADALGLSVVHVNRTLQRLRSDGMISYRSGVITLLRPKALKGFASYGRNQGVDQRALVA